MKYLYILFFLFLYQNILADNKVETPQIRYFQTSQNVLNDCNNINKEIKKEIIIDKIYTCSEDYVNFNLFYANITYLQNIIGKIIALYGEDSLEVKFLYLELSLAYLYIDNKEVAKSLLELTNETKENMKYERDSTLIIKTIYIKANYFYLIGDIKESRNMFKDALRYQKKYRGETSTNYLTLLSTLSILESNSDNIEQAISYIDEIRSIFKKNSLEIDNESRIRILMNMGKVYQKNKEFNKARSAYLVALEVINLKNIMHPVAIEGLSEFASLLIKTNNERDYIASKMVCDTALEIQKSIQYKDNLIIANIYLVMAQYEYIGKNYKKSKNNFEKALSIIKKLKVDEEQKQDFLKGIKKSIKELENKVGLV